MADRISSPLGLRKLAAGLDIPGHRVESELQSNGHIVDAACNVLLNWRFTVATDEEAYGLLRAALMECGFKSVVAQVLDE